MRVTLNSKADKPVALISGSNWNLECWFLWREENRRTRRKTLGAGTRTNNKLNPHVTPGPGIEPGPQWWEASALTTAPSLLPNGSKTSSYRNDKDYSLFAPREPCPQHLETNFAATCNNCIILISIFSSNRYFPLNTIVLVETVVHQRLKPRQFSLQTLWKRRFSWKRVKKNKTVKIAFSKCNSIKFYSVT